MSQTSKKTALSDVQLLLLSTAITRANGSLLPPSAALGELGDRIRTAIAGLLRRKLVVEVAGDLPDAVWRTKGAQSFGLVITRAGREAIGDAVEPECAKPVSALPPMPRQGSKLALVISLLARPGGATLLDLSAATHWLPHTMRAALTGLRKQGYAIERSKLDGETCYAISLGAPL